MGVDIQVHSLVNILKKQPQVDLKTDRGKAPLSHRDLK